MKKLIPTDIMLEVLSKDIDIKNLIKKYGIIERQLEENYFVNLVSSIVGQQLSNKVADIIWARVENLLKQVTTEKILETSDESFRECGISFQKISYIKNLANAVKNCDINLDNIDAMSNEEVIAGLTKIKGIGKWTAEMFLIFSLAREDVFSLGDGGLNNALHKLLQKEKLTKAQIVEYTDNFKPYRSYLSLYLWKILEN